MALRSNRLYFLLTWLPLLTATSGVFLGRMPFRGQRPAIAHAYGRYSARQISERAEPLCRLLAPDAPELRIQCMALPVTNSANSPTGYQWEVAWSDAAAQPKGRILFDAKTGEVETVSRYDLNNRAVRVRIGPAQAAAEARRWLEALRGPEAGSWRMDSPPEAAPRQWRLRFLSAHTRASLTLTADGELVFARFR